MIALQTPFDASQWNVKAECLSACQVKHYSQLVSIDIQYNSSSHKRFPSGITCLLFLLRKLIAARISLMYILKDIALLMGNQYASYTVVEFVTTTSARVALPGLQRLMTNYGIPEEIKMDNGPPFNGREFTEFAEIQGSNIERSRLHDRSERRL